MPKIICIGEALIDFKYNNNSFIMNAGGAPANVCACIGKLNGNATLLTKLSDDFFSKFLIDSLKKYNVDLSNIIIDSNSKTGLAFIKDDEYNFYFKNSSCVNLEDSEIKEELFDKDDILHFGSVCLGDYPSLDAHRCAIKYHKGIKSFDVNLRENLWSDKALMIKRVIEFIPYANILKLTLDELYEVSGIKDEAKAIDYIISIADNMKIIIITKGSEGVKCYNKNKESISIPSIYVKPVDTTGAGDTFIGSFLFYIQKNKVELKLENIIPALEYATKAASFKVSHMGTQEGMPSYLDI